MNTIKKKLLDALEDARGIVSIACKNAGVSRGTYYNYYKEDEEFKELADEVAESAIDHVESKLFEKIDGVSMQAGAEIDEEGNVKTKVYTVPPSDTAIIFYLKTKGKKRGYVEKQEIKHEGGINNTVTLDIG